MKIKLNSVYQRDELEGAAARLAPTERSRITIRKTTGEIPDDLVPTVELSLARMREELLAKNVAFDRRATSRRRGRLNAIGSVRRHIEAAKS